MAGVQELAEPLLAQISNHNENNGVTMNQDLMSDILPYIAAPRMEGNAEFELQTSYRERIISTVENTVKELSGIKVAIDRHNIDAVYASYTAFISQTHNIAATGIISILSNTDIVDQLYDRYYEQSDILVRKAIDMDIQTFQFSANMDRKMIVIIFFMNKIISDVISDMESLPNGKKLWDYIDPGTKSCIESGMMVYTDGGNLPLTYKDIFKAVLLGNSQGVFGFNVMAIGDIVNRMYLQQHSKIVSESDMFAYLYKYSVC